MNEKLLQKYNKPIPRYTSYPPVPFWRGRPSESEWINHIKMSYQSDVGVDLYVHVPFCEKLCYYCGCNRTITKNHDVEDGFIELLLKEWSIYQEKLGFAPAVNSLHFGGGTPTFLSPENLNDLLSKLLETKTPNFIGSIEIDPRTVKREHFDVLKKWGIERVSLGIQDFDVDVQTAINRRQTPEMVSSIVAEIRKRNFQSLNFDLIYGLPKQTVETISKTFEIVREMRPDMIAFYSYAHLPQKIKNQRLINDADLPNAEQKRQLFQKGEQLLSEHGYIEIGLDHFALPESFLAKAMNVKKMKRNFMGYVDQKSNVLVGLGPTSISDSVYSFVQNEKEVEDYRTALMQGRLPLSSGHVQSTEDLLVQSIIQELMCNHEIHLPPSAKLSHWEAISHELEEFQKDELISIKDEVVSVLPLGKALLRNIAHAFDFHSREQLEKKNFSQSV